MSMVTVSLADRSYPIHIGPRACDALQGCITAAGGASQVVIIADRAVADLHLARLREVLSETPLVITFEPGEASKSLAAVEALCGRLAEGRVDRDAVIVAFGGGVAGDLAGFVAATYLRGVRFIQVPTTLLAAVDASVGGKTGVNLRAGKNLVGAFHQPRAVIIDTDFLQTLSPRDFAAGLAESVKHAAICDPQLLAWHESNVEAVTRRDGDTLATLITRSCEIKAGIVSQDERETGVRAILNHGHTIGHALEHLLEYDLRHGECVALGMIAENEIAGRRGWLAREQAERVRRLLAEFGLPMWVPRAVAPADVLAACRIDKKVRAGAVNFILLREIGRPVRVADVTEEEVGAAVSVIQP